MAEYNPFTLKVKTVLITGASSGIGRETAIACSRSGATVIVTGRDELRLYETLAMLEGTGHQMIQCDLTNSLELDELVHKIEVLSGVVHCAGISKRVPLKLIKEERFREMFNVNFFSSAFLTQKLVAKGKLQKKSSIVFISSVASNYSTIGSIMYMSTKGALNSLMRGLAIELSKYQIRVNAIQPGMIKTKIANTLSEDEIKLDLSNYPLGRYGEPEEVAWAAIYLLSNATEWMTGSIIKLDGGLTLR